MFMGTKLIIFKITTARFTCQINLFKIKHNIKQQQRQIFNTGILYAQFEQIDFKFHG